MIKIDLAHVLSERMEIPLKQADEYLTIFMDVVGETLEKGEKVQLAGFGVFGSRYVPEHQGRNPKTGESLTIPGCHYPIFKPGKGLRDRVANCQQSVCEVKNKPEEVKPAAPAVKTSRKKKSNSPQANV